MRRSTNLVRLVAAIVCLLPAVTAVGVARADSTADTTAGPAAAADQMRGAAFTPVEPCRLLDTRVGDGVPVQADGAAFSWRVQTAGRCGVPADIAAVVLTVTAVNALGDGYISVQPAESPVVATSNVNFRPGRRVANTVVTATSADGAVDVHASTVIDVIVDISGVFVDTDGSVAAGRLVPVSPRRIADTRNPGPFAVTGLARFGAGDLRIDLGGLVPDDAVAVAVTVTAAASQPGFLAVLPPGSDHPDTSILNLDATNPTRATIVFAAVTEQQLTVHRSAPGHLVVDLWGYFTGPSAPVSSDGLFVPEAPVRVWDSRIDHEPLHPGGQLTRTVAPDDAAIAALNVTATAATDVGYLTLGPAGEPQPGTSNLNYRWVEPVAGATIVRNTTAGVTFWSRAGTHVVVDRFGWFTGGAAAAVAAPDRNPMPARGGRVMFVSDSSFAGLRWTGALDLLVGADFDARLESCRRLIGASCRGREGYAPRTALAEIESVVPGTVDVLVIGTGYNDFAGQFRDGFEQIMTAARRASIDRVLWLTYREPVTYRSPSHASYAATFRANNMILHQAAASGAWPELRLLDWNAHSADMPDWVTPDGVHLTIAGAHAAAAFISDALAHDDRRPCPAGGPAEPGGWCAEPTGRR